MYPREIGGTLVCAKAIIRSRLSWKSDRSPRRKAASVPNAIRLLSA